MRRHTLTDRQTGARKNTKGHNKNLTDLKRSVCVRERERERERDESETFSQSASDIQTKKEFTQLEE